MAANIQMGDEVYIYRNRLPTLPDQGKAFFKTVIVERQKRSARVRMPNGEYSDFISTKFIHHRVGVAIIQFGDFLSESTLIDPLSKTILQCCRILFGDDSYVRYIKIRSLVELSRLCESSELHPFEHIVVIGHGSRSGSICTIIEEITSSAAGREFSQNNPRPWDFTFLCCYLGRTAFAKTFSMAACCKSLIAPFNSVHGAVSAQFMQTYLVKALLEGETTAVAHRHGSTSTPAKSAFRLWQNGKLLH